MAHLYRVLYLYYCSSNLFMYFCYIRNISFFVCLHDIQSVASMLIISGY